MAKLPSLCFILKYDVRRIYSVSKNLKRVCLIFCNYLAQKSSQNKNEKKNNRNENLKWKCPASP